MDATKHMIVIGDNTNPKFLRASFCAIHESKGIGNIFPGIQGFGLGKDTLRGDPLGHQIFFAAIPLTDRFVGAFSAGDNTDGIRMPCKIGISCIQAVFEDEAWLLMSHLSSKYDDIVKLFVPFITEVADHGSEAAEEDEGKQNNQAVADFP